MPEAVRQFPLAVAHAAATVTAWEPNAITPVFPEGDWSEIQMARVGAVVESCFVPELGQVWEPERKVADPMGSTRAIRMARVRRSMRIVYSEFIQSSSWCHHKKLAPLSRRHWPQRRRFQP